MTAGLVILYTYPIIDNKKGEIVFAGQNFYDADFLRGRLFTRQTFTRHANATRSSKFKLLRMRSASELTYRECCCRR